MPSFPLFHRCSPSLDISSSILIQLHIRFMSMQACFEAFMPADDPEKYFWMAALVSSSDAAEVSHSCRPTIHHPHMLVLSENKTSAYGKTTLLSLGPGFSRNCKIVLFKHRRKNIYFAKTSVTQPLSYSLAL